LLPLRLQPHIHFFSAAVIVNIIGVKLLPLCEPSQKGWFFD